VQCHGVTFKLAVPVTVTVRCHQTVTNWQVGCASLSHGDRRDRAVPLAWCHGVQVGGCASDRASDRAIDSEVGASEVQARHESLACCRRPGQLPVPVAVTNLNLK